MAWPPDLPEVAKARRLPQWPGKGRRQTLYAYKEGAGDQELFKLVGIYYLT